MVVSNGWSVLKRVRTLCSLGISQEFYREDQTLQLPDFEVL